MITTSTNGHYADKVLYYVQSHAKIVGHYYDAVDWSNGLNNGETNLYTGWSNTESVFKGTLLPQPPLDFGGVDWVSANGSIILSYLRSSHLSGDLARYQVEALSNEDNNIYHRGRLLTSVTPLYAVLGASIYKNKIIAVGNTISSEGPIPPVPDKYGVYIADLPGRFPSKKSNPLVLEWEELVTYEDVLYMPNGYERLRGFHFNAAGNQAVCIVYRTFFSSGDEVPNSDYYKTSTMLIDINCDEDTGDFSAEFNYGEEEHPGMTETIEVIPGTITVTLDKVGGGSRGGNCETGSSSGTTTVYAKRGCSNGVDPISTHDVTADWNWSYCSGGGAWAHYKSTWTMENNKTLIHLSGSILIAADYCFLAPDDDGYDPDDTTKQKLVYGIETYESTQTTIQSSEYEKNFYEIEGNLSVSTLPDLPLTFRRDERELQQSVGKEGVRFDGIEAVVPVENGWIPTVHSPDYTFPPTFNASDYLYSGSGKSGCWWTVTKEDGDYLSDQDVILENAGGLKPWWWFVNIHGVDLRYKHLSYSVYQSSNTLEHNAFTPEIRFPDYSYNDGYSEKITSTYVQRDPHYLYINGEYKKLLYEDTYVDSQSSVIEILNCTPGETSGVVQKVHSFIWKAFFLDASHITCLPSGGVFVQSFIYPIEWDNRHLTMELFTVNGIEFDPFEVTQEFAALNLPPELILENQVRFERCGII